MGYTNDFATALGAVEATRIANLVQAGNPSVDKQPAMGAFRLVKVNRQGRPGQLDGPGKMVKGMGGAMDRVAGVRRVVV